jgi:ferritin-like metal-binding protein YciE
MESSPREVKVTEREKKALREFCLSSIQQKRQAEDAKAQKKIEADAAKKAKEALDAWIREQGSKCFAIPKSRYKELEEKLSAQGIPPLPTYVRLKKTTSDSTISPACVEECIQELSWETLKEIQDAATPIEKVTRAIVDTLRKNIRCTKESVQISDSLEKGSKHIEIPDMDETAIEQMLQLHIAKHKSKEISKSTHSAEQETKSELKKLEAVVDKVLTKTNKNTQPITLEGVEGIHKIVKKTSSRSEKLTLALFQEFLVEALEQLNLGSTDKEAWHTLEKQKGTLIKIILLKINSMPKKEATNIKFVSKPTLEMEEEE